MHVVLIFETLPIFTSLNIIEDKYLDLVILNSWMHAHLPYIWRKLARLLKCLKSDRKNMYKYMPVLWVNGANTLSDSAEMNNAP